MERTMVGLVPRSSHRVAFFIVAALMVLAAGTANASWVWQNPLPQGNTLNDLAFIDGNTGYAVGAMGLIMQTTDRGGSWTTIASGTTANLNRIVFATADSGWIVGDNGTVLWTKTGGNVWMAQTSPNSSALYDMQFLDHMIGWAVGANGTILHTNNAGFTWTKIPSGVTASLRGLSFVDATHGWVVGFNGTAMNTIDGGDSWTLRGGTNANINLYTVYAETISSAWVAGDYGNMWHTRNAGALWLPDVSNTPERINRFAVMGGWAVAACNGGNVILNNTTDSIWDFSFAKLTDANLLGIQLVQDTGNIYMRVRIVGEKGVILNSDDYGYNYESLAPGTRVPLYSVYFTGTTAGFAAGDSGLVMRTNNGVDWFYNQIMPGGLWRGIAFDPRDQKIGVVVGRGGTVMWTRDAGVTWTRDNTAALLNTDWYAISFSTNGTAYIVGGGGAIMSFDTAWHPVPSPTTRNLFSIYMADNEYGFIGGQTGTLYKTTNAGLTWAKQNPNTAQDIYGLQIFHGNSSWNGSDSVEASNGFAVGNTGTVRRTTDGGKTWLVVNMGQGSGGAFRGVRFRNQWEGIICGPAGSVWATTNGGSSWMNQPTPTRHNLNSVWTVTQSIAYCVGDAGTVLFNGDAGLPVELTSFDGWQVSPNAARLVWSTASEVNNARFELERRTRNGVWVPVGTVNGNGTTSEKHDYSYVDGNLASDVYVYRLKQVNNDGSSSYTTQEVEVAIGAPASVTLYQNFPNPFNPSTRIAYELKSASTVLLEVFDAAGRSVATLASGFEGAGHHDVVFDASNIASGTYTYQLTVDGAKFSHQMTITK
jgi:photosystem II stability/assembly factor-like uncharacterized protein